MDAHPALAELLVAAGAEVTALGRLGFEEHPHRATLWLAPYAVTDGDDGRREGALLTAEGEDIGSAPRGVPVIVSGIWDGASIRGARVREPSQQELRIVRAIGDPHDPSVEDVPRAVVHASLTAIGEAAAVLSFGGTRDRVHHYVLAVTPELVEYVLEGRVRTDILAALVPAGIRPF